MTEPIQAEHRRRMNELAGFLDEQFNGFDKGDQRKVGFVLLVFNFGDTGRCNYISNADRQDIIVLLKELTARFEGQPYAEGRA